MRWVVKKCLLVGKKLLEKIRHFSSLFYKSVFLSKKDSVKRHFSHDSVLPSYLLTSCGCGRGPLLCYFCLFTGQIQNTVFQIFLVFFFENKIVYQIICLQKNYNSTIYSIFSILNNLSKCHKSRDIWKLFLIFCFICRDFH